MYVSLEYKYKHYTVIKQIYFTIGETIFAQ